MAVLNEQIFGPQGGMDTTLFTDNSIHPFLLGLTEEANNAKWYLNGSIGVSYSSLPYGIGTFFCFIPLCDVKMYWTLDSSDNAVSLKAGNLYYVNVRKPGSYYYPYIADENGNILYEYRSTESYLKTLSYVYFKYIIL